MPPSVVVSHGLLPGPAPGGETGGEEQHHDRVVFVPVVVAVGVAIAEHPQTANKIDGKTEKVHQNRDFNSGSRRTAYEDGLEGLSRDVQADS